VEFAELIRRRYSVRSYHGTPIPDDVLERVLDAFVLAPTAANRQPFGLIVTETGGREQELRRVYDTDWFAAQPPIIVCACSIPRIAWRRRDRKNYADVDVAIAMDHLVLAATNEGLGTCWIGAFDPIAAREAFGLPDGVDPIAMTPLGYPADTAPAKRRKPKAELIHRGRW